MDDLLRHFCEMSARRRCLMRFHSLGPSGKRATVTAMQVGIYGSFISRRILTSRDVEDILLVVDGRKELAAEIEDGDADIRNFIAEQFQALQKHYNFDDFVAGNIRGPQGRIEIVRNRFAALAASGGRT